MQQHGTKIESAKRTTQVAVSDLERAQSSTASEKTLETSSSLTEKPSLTASDRLSQQNPSPRIIEVLTTRLQTWHKLLQELVTNFEAKAASQQRHAQVVSKCANITSNERVVNKEFSPDSGVNRLLSAMHAFNVAYFTESTNNAKQNEVFVIPGMEVKGEMKKVGRDEIPLDKEVEREGAQIESLSDNFRKALKVNKEKGELSNVPNEGSLQKVDPWLLKNEVEYRRGIHERNIASHHVTARRRQDSYAAFEANLVLELKKLLNQRYDAEMQFTNAMKPLMDEIKASMDSLEPENEFGLFVADHRDKLIYDDSEKDTGTSGQDVGGGFRKDSAILGLGEMPGVAGEGVDPSVDVVYENELMLKKGIMLTKSWKAQKAVITGTGYLHAFATDINVRKLKDESDESIPKMMIRYEPEYSLSLRDCVIQSHPIAGRDECEIELHEIGRGGLFTKGVTIHVFKAITREAAEEWWRELAKFARDAYVPKGEEVVAEKGAKEQ